MSKKIYHQMKYSYRRAFLWLSVYVACALVPLGIALSGYLPQSRSFWIELGVAFGFISLAMFALQSLFSGRNAWVAPTYGMDNLINFHRQAALVALFFFFAHPITLILANPEFLDFLDPRVNFLRTLALTTAIFSMILIITSSLWRTYFKLNYEYWRALHALLALAIVFIGLVHAVQVSNYLEPLWKKVLLVVWIAAAMYLIIHSRAVRPWFIRKKPYRITDVKSEEDHSYTLKLEPVHGKRMPFIPGQFAWITIGNTPFSLQQHPFTIASGAHADHIAFTAKEEGDFTQTWKDIEAGTTAFLEGPYGSFTPEPGMNLFLVMGGIGITPAMSMLRTMREEKDEKEAILIYCNVNQETIKFKKELEEMSKEIKLKVIHLLKEPPETWEGETGLLRPEILKKYLPSNPERFMYFACGPGPMMDITETGLRDLGVDWRLIYTERFNIV